MLSRLLPRITRRLITYGLDKPADVTGRDVVLGPFEARCLVGDRARSRSRFPAATTCRTRSRPSPSASSWTCRSQIAAALGQFSGAERRFQRLGEAGGVLVIDDYGHHPTEIAAVIAAPAQRRQRCGRVLVVFQPHRYSRTRDLMDDVRAGAGRRRRNRADRHLRGGRTAAPGHHARVVRRAGAAATSGVPVHACRISTTSRTSSWDRARPATPSSPSAPGRSARSDRGSWLRSAREGARERQGCADRRFRRARVRPVRRRRRWSPAGGPARARPLRRRPRLRSTLGTGCRVS